jgi:hypothetical protein
MTNVHGLHRPANAAISNTEPESQSFSQVWQSLRRQFKKFQEPKQEPATKCDSSSIISDANTLVANKGISQQKADEKW